MIRFPLADLEDLVVSLQAGVDALQRTGNLYIEAEDIKDLLEKLVLADPEYEQIGFYISMILDDIIKRSRDVSVTELHK